jgi:hypothetical protein
MDRRIAKKLSVYFFDVLPALVTRAGIVIAANFITERAGSTRAED